MLVAYACLTSPWAHEAEGPPALLNFTPVASWIQARLVADSEAEAEVRAGETDFGGREFRCIVVVVEEIMCQDVHNTHGCLEVFFGSCP